MKSELDLQKEFIEQPELKEQIEFLKKSGKKNFQGVVVVDAFLRGIRDLGYKDTPYALNELNDNSFQAGARNIHYELIGKNTIDELVIYDDGHGMVKKYLDVAVAWGGTHRQNSRKGFGKYGYGLPSASLSLAKKYTVYSKAPGEDWAKITFDITSLEENNNTNLDKIKSTPEYCKLPDFIKNFEGKNYSVKKLKSGTIIHLEELDRIKPLRINDLKTVLLDNFGQTYFKLLKNTNMYVDDILVEPIDICFATEGLRGFKSDTNNFSVPIDNDDYYGEKNIPIKDSEGNEHEIQVRWSRLPSLFYRTSEEFGKDIEKAFLKGNIPDRIPRNEQKGLRWRVGRKNDGIVFRRLGRRMDTVRNFGGKLNMQNNSRFWRCEVNFPAVLDEHFSVNTSKQQIIPNERVMETLENADIFKLLRRIEKAYYEENQVLVHKIEKLAKEDLSQRRESETETDEATDIIGGITATPEYEERKQKAEIRKQKKIEEIAAKKSISVEEATKDYEDIYKGRPTKFTEDSLGKNRPFLDFQEHGDTIEVIANIDHSFYKSFYMGKGSNPESRKSWETFFLMFATLFYKYTEDHQDFINQFMNELGERLKTVARKRYEKSQDDAEDVELLDDKLPIKN